MNLPKYAFENRAVVYFMVAVIIIGGIFSFANLGRLEDPDFTVKTAMIITAYPGASPEEVEEEVTGRLEKALQELTQLDNLYSISRAGLSIIRVDIKQEYWGDRLPQVWDEMRNKITDAQVLLPPGAGTPDIADDFSFVYGFVLAVTGDGFSYAQLEDYSKYLKKELGLTEGVARAELWGVQPKVVYVDISETQLAELNVTRDEIILTLTAQNMVVPAGGIDVGSRRMRIVAAGEFEKPEDIERLVVRRSISDIVVNAIEEYVPDTAIFEDRSTELITIGDIATVREGYLEPPISKMRFNGRPAIAIALATPAGGNVPVTGGNIDERLNELMAELPVGIEVERFAWQSTLVDESINAFVVNLGEAVLIVLVVITLAMGWRMGIIIGSGLVLTIMATLIYMMVMEIPMHRVSLGALVVALGMMVDNSIVVAEGTMLRLKRGMDPRKAAIEGTNQPSIPLIGATLVAAAAFYPVYASPFDAGEYGGMLFVVVGVSLLVSWVLSMTVTPLQCVAMLKVDKNDASNADPYGGKMFTAFRNLVSTAIRRRKSTMSLMVVLLLISVYGATQMTIQFFPFSTRSQFMIDVWAPEGTRVQAVSEGAKLIEQRLDDDERVTSYASFIGAGGPRFYLPVEPELPFPAYTQIVVNTKDFKSVTSLIEDLKPWLEDNMTQAMVRFREYTVGPGDVWPFELRVVGPSNADLGTLRKIGAEGMAMLNNHPMAENVRTDMRQRTPKVVLDYDNDRARYAVVSRLDVGLGAARSYDGVPVGLYRENEDLLPIILRDDETAREKAAQNLDLVAIRRTLSTDTVPLGQVVNGINVEWEDPIITRWNRGRQIAIQATPRNETFMTLYQDISKQFEEMELPPGYSLYWDGEYKSMIDNVLALMPGMVPALVIMLTICVMLFNSMKPPLVIFMTVPFAIIGFVAGLLALDIAFSFMAILGAMSLVGMMIKNSIVLIDEIRLEEKNDKTQFQAIVDAAVSRVRPVVLAALTTVLGVMPLLQDVFWVSMACTIVFGLIVGTMLTMVVIPVLYSIVHKVKAE
jgi:multidrug efflux pump subunit AcrB